MAPVWTSAGKQKEWEFGGRGKVRGILLGKGDTSREKSKGDTSRELTSRELLGAHGRRPLGRRFVISTETVTAGTFGSAYSDEGVSLFTVNSALASASKFASDASNFEIAPRSMSARITGVVGLPTT